ncbi:transposase, partial [Escherichia coli TA255]
MLCRSYPYACGDPPKLSVSGLYGISERESSLMLYEQFGDLKFKYRNREFWCRGYYVDT